MMKLVYFLLGLVLACLITTLARADSLSIGDELKNIPALKQGIAFSLIDNKINYLSTVEILKWKGFSLEGGYAGASSETYHKAVAVISYQIAKLKDFGVTVPILDLVEFNVGGYAGFGRITGSNEYDAGLSLTLISLKW